MMVGPFENRIDAHEGRPTCAAGAEASLVVAVWVAPVNSQEMAIGLGGLLLHVLAFNYICTDATTTIPIQYHNTTPGLLKLHFNFKVHGNLYTFISH